MNSRSRYSAEGESDLSCQITCSEDIVILVEHKVLIVPYCLDTIYGHVCPPEILAKMCGVIQILP